MGAHTTHCSIGLSDKIKVYEWLKVNMTQEKVRAANHTKASILEAASKTLGIAIPMTTITALLKELGIESVRIHSRMAFLEKTSEHGKFNGSVAHGFRLRILALEQQVAALYHDLGKPLPKGE